MYGAASPRVTSGVKSASLEPLHQAPDVPALTLQLLAWIAERSPSYAETIEAWKTSCPRLSIWEDALTDGLVRVDRGRVFVTARGNELLSTP
jgi:hypothetical protein